ncbi:MAG TPA: hypothetical protein VEI52_19240 [Terriglobales bacterium]|nr:hypothetical protein [Terriglobales bacterium]
MKGIIDKFIAYLLVLVIGFGPSLVVGQTSAGSFSAVLPSPDEPWPRITTYQGATISIFQPQLESWTGNQMHGRAAVRIQTSAKTDYGVIWLTARTEVDKVNRVVTLLDPGITKQNFPTLPNNGYAYTSALLKDLPWNKTMALDLLEADLAVTNAAAQQKTYELENNPPAIFFSITPAVLTLIDGAPVMQASADNMQKVINTRALILFDTENSTYYLALMDGWMEAQTVQGPWSPAKHEPARDLNRIKKAAVDNGSNQPLGNPQESLKDAEEDGALPTVYVSTVPAELLVTQGEPQLTPIFGTSLEFVSNSGADIFLDTSSRSYYVLIAGRWFQSSSLASGQWSYVPGSGLPAGFAQIPPYSPKADVLVSVPGTSQAKEAVIANSIPQTATISRTAAQLNVTYSGAPDFQPIQGTSLSYAVNTTTPVVQVPGNSYYAVENGVWFTATSASGPWAVATSVPPVIYTIPPSSPLHYVTYVYMYGFTPNVVYVGYTPGYYGTVVSSSGVVVYGTGYYYAPYVTPAVWVPAPYTYGVGATFAWSAAAGWALGFGMGMAIGSWCGPWWGPVGGWGWGYYGAPAWGWGGYGGAAAANVYGHWGNTAFAGTRAAWANPWTGNVGAGTRGAYYNPVTGNSGVAARGANYNAYTGNYEAGSRVSGYNPSTGNRYAGGRGTVGNAYTGNYASGARGMDYNQNTGVVRGGAAGVYGNAYTGQSVAGTHGFAYNTNTGNGIGHYDNNTYADHDGSVYKYNPSGGWQQHTSSGWGAPSSSFSRSEADGWASARNSGSSRWDNFRSGGWGGGFGGGGWADRGGGGGFGGFRGGGFRR